jgi:hypothetical protein
MEKAVNGPYILWELVLSWLASGTAEEISEFLFQIFVRDKHAADKAVKGQSMRLTLC